MGQNEKAMAWFEKALDAGAGDLFLKVDPVYDSLRVQPKFWRLLNGSDSRSSQCHGK